jgi:transposase InsO family protein
LQLWSAAALPGCIARVLHGEKMAGLCAEFGISRKMGYKIYDRYKDCGLQGLTDRSRRPYPLTVTDFASRYPLSCDALLATRETFAFAVLERAFKDFGLPTAIGTDNGIPFASPHALHGLTNVGLTKRSVWWLITL